MNTNSENHEHLARHLRLTEPSPWVVRFCQNIPKGGTVLDLACGGGRHSAVLLDQGYKVCAVDKNTDAIQERLGHHANLEIMSTDLETGADPFSGGGSLAGRQFEGIVTVNYLYRDLIDPLINALNSDGVLIYETFALGNEDHARPRNPDHLLRQGELLDLAKGRLQVIAYEHGLMTPNDLPGVKQRLVAVNNLHTSTREDGQPAPQKI